MLYFGSRRALESGERFRDLAEMYPGASIVGCSGTRTISPTAIEEDVVVATAIRFERTAVRVARESVADPRNSYAAGLSLGQTLARADLVAAIVLADGLTVDGSGLTAGLEAVLGRRPLIVGGMASDPRDYRRTLVGSGGRPESHEIAAVGLYGDALRCAHGRGSGWDAFGPRRRITRSSGNVLFELDGKPAYDLYERYLGDELVGRAASDGVVIPIQISPPDRPGDTLVRAPLAVDEGPASMTFAGHVPEGWIARLLRGNTDRLILSAGDAAREARFDDAADAGDTLAFIVSCAGREQIMGQRTEEELDLVAAELGPRTVRAGFYSFGEIAPVQTGGAQVHNQTIAITSLREVAA